MKPLRWSVCIHFQRGIGAGFPLPHSPLQATNVACFTPKFWFNQRKPLHWNSIDSCLNSICQNVVFFFHWLSKWHVCFGWQLDLHPDCPNIFGSSGKQMVIAAVFKPIFMQGEIGNGGRIRSLCAPTFSAQSLFLIILVKKKKFLYRWDAVWVCLLLLWLLFVHERASSAFFH